MSADTSVGAPAVISPGTSAAAIVSPSAGTGASVEACPWICASARASSSAPSGIVVGPFANISVCAVSAAVARTSASISSDADTGTSASVSTGARAAAEAGVKSIGTSACILRFSAGAGARASTANADSSACPTGACPSNLHFSRASSASLAFGACNSARRAAIFFARRTSIAQKFSATVAASAASGLYSAHLTFFSVTVEAFAAFDAFTLFTPASLGELCTSARARFGAGTGADVGACVKYSGGGGGFERVSRRRVTAGCSQSSGKLISFPSTLRSSSVAWNTSHCSRDIAASSLSSQLFFPTV